MADIVDSVTRSRMMSGIRAKDTAPELLIRSKLHSAGFRYRLHCRMLPGKPDLVFPRYHALVLINGCFWHLHGCHLFKWPTSRPDFWHSKLEANKRRDNRNFAAYRKDGWRVLTVWECALKGKYRKPAGEIADEISTWLKSDSPSLEISGEANLPTGRHDG